MQSSAATVQEYLDSLPADRRETVERVRGVILQNLPQGYKEGMMWGMITYFVPLEAYPDTYNKQPLCYVALASQKNYLSLYLMNVYGDQETAFRQAYERTGKKLDMGKSCIRFKSLDDLPLDLIGKYIADTSMDDFIQTAKAVRQQ